MDMSKEKKYISKTNTRRRRAFKKAFEQYKSYCKDKGFRLSNSKYQFEQYEAEVRDRATCMGAIKKYFFYTSKQLNYFTDQFKGGEVCKRLKHPFFLGRSERDFWEKHQSSSLEVIDESNETPPHKNNTGNTGSISDEPNLVIANNRPGCNKAYFDYCESRKAGVCFYCYVSLIVSQYLLPYVFVFLHNKHFCCFPCITLSFRATKIYSCTQTRM